MNDLISRKETLDSIEKIRQNLQMMDDTHRADIIMGGVYLCEKAVMHQPSIQTQKMRGKWIRTRTMEHDGELYCDKCGQEHPEQEIIWNYCPNCGARMDGGEQDERKS